MPSARSSFSQRRCTLRDNSTTSRPVRVRGPERSHLQPVHLPACISDACIVAGQLSQAEGVWLDDAIRNLMRGSVARSASGLPRRGFSSIHTVDFGENEQPLLCCQSSCSSQQLCSAAGPQASQMTRHGSWWSLTSRLLSLIDKAAHVCARSEAAEDDHRLPRSFHVGIKLRG